MPTSPTLRNRFNPSCKAFVGAATADSILDRMREGDDLLIALRQAPVRR